tara:strand:+ start:312 stop:521 length:210 start_codon:yes stop_codon:yes gene_type:complete
MSQEPTQRRNPETGEWEPVEPDNAYAYDEQRDEWVTKQKLEDRNILRLLPVLLLGAVIAVAIKWLLAPN